MTRPRRAYVVLDRPTACCICARPLQVAGWSTEQGPICGGCRWADDLDDLTTPRRDGGPPP